jgi:hypothetical protein
MSPLDRPAVITSFTGSCRFLSSFYPCPVADDSGRSWPSAEHLYQALKTADPAQQDWVHDAPAAPAAKRRGRQVAVRPGWDSLKRMVMLDVTGRKFAQNPGLAASLAGTGRARLVEGNTWHDNYWGSCACSGCAARSGSDQYWADRGLNFLGLALMAVRDVIRPLSDEQLRAAGCKVA